MAANGVSVATSIVVLTGSMSALYVSIGASAISSLIHIIEGIVSCVLQPRKSLEHNVAAVGKASGAVETQLQILQKEVLSLREVNTQQENQLKKRNAELQETQYVVEAKIAEVTQLTERLEAVNAQLAEAPHLIEAWQQATEQVSKEVALLNPSHLEKDIESVTERMKGLALSNAAFASKADQLGKSAVAISKTQASWEQMVDQLQKTFQGLATDYDQKRKLLNEADSRIQSLTERVSELKEVDQRLQDLTPKYEKLLQELTEAKRQMKDLVPILQSNEFKEFMKKMKPQ
jgi:DNA repair exonuclease SbcCD ATPase subunit